MIFLPNLWNTPMRKVRARTMKCYKMLSLLVQFNLNKKKRILKKLLQCKVGTVIHNICFYSWARTNQINWTAQLKCDMHARVGRWRLGWHYMLSNIYVLLTRWHRWHKTNYYIVLSEFSLEVHIAIQRRLRRFTDLD